MCPAIVTFKTVLISRRNLCTRMRIGHNREQMEALQQHQLDLTNLTLHYIKLNRRQRRRKHRRMGRTHFCRHLDTSESSLEMKVLEQSTVERRCYLYVTHSCRFTYITHMLLICLHKLCIFTLLISSHVMHTPPLDPLVTL